MMLGKASFAAFVFAAAQAFEVANDGSDGIWTGYDYNDPAMDIGVTNGVPYGISAEANRRIIAATAINSSTDQYESASNVQRAQRLLPKAQWDSWFPYALPVYTYESFMKAVYKFPAFCGEQSPTETMDDTCKLDLAAFLAHVKHESGSLQYVDETYCVDNPADACKYSTAEGDPATAIWPPVSGQRYFGRGPLQLSWNYNYGMFSSVAFNGGLTDKDILLSDPGQVSTNGILAFASALWFYMTPQSPKPSMHDVITG